MHDPLEAGHVVRTPHGLRQFQHSGEHHGHELTVGDAVALNGVQTALGVELVHDHRCDAARLNRHRPHRRCGVVQGRWAQVDRLGVEPEAHQRRHHAWHLGGRLVLQLALDALRSTRCAGGVLQQVTFDLVVDRRIRFVCNAFRVAVPTVEIVVGDDQHRRKPVRQFGVQVFENVAQRRRTDDGLGAAVVDDVGRFRRGQVGVDRDVVQPAAARRPHHGVIVLVVLHQDRDGVALAQAVAPEEVRQPVRARLELAEGHRRAGRIHDDGRLVGVRLGMLANLHA